MASKGTVPPATEPVAGIKDGIIGVLSALGNPPAAAVRLRMRWFWIYPFILLVAGAEILQIALADQRMHIARVALEQRGMTGDQIQNQMSMMAKFAPVGWVLTPIVMLVIFAIAAWLVSAVASILGTRGRFPEYLGLVAAGGVPTVIQMIATIFLVRTKPLDEINSALDLQPPFGLNIFVENAPKAILGLLAFFSVFQIWAIVMTALMFAALFRSSVGKGFAATCPAWIIGMIFAMVGALFS
jgi:hypothetical protein